MTDLDTGPGQVSLERGRPGLDKHSQKLLARGRCLSKGGARDWIDILKARLLARGRCLSKGGAREDKGLAQRQDRGRCLSKGGVRFGTKAGLKPVHDGTIFYSICL